MTPSTGVHCPQRRRAPFQVQQRRPPKGGGAVRVLPEVGSTTRSRLAEGGLQVPTGSGTATKDRTNGGRTDTGKRAVNRARAGSGKEASLTSRFGPLEIDWPRSVGFFGGAAIAVATGIVEPPLGLFIAAVPFLKMLDLPELPNRLRFVAQVFEGVAKPVGGDSQGTIRIVTAKGASDEPVQSGG